MCIIEFGSEHFRKGFGDATVLGFKDLTYGIGGASPVLLLEGKCYNILVTGMHPWNFNNWDV
jgi:hypothetical protein